MDTLFDFEVFPRLETTRLLLRELRREDAEAVFHIFSDPEVMQYLGMDVFTSLEQAQLLIERQRQRFEQKERQGELHERSFWKGAFHDLVMSALLKSTWES